MEGSSPDEAAAERKRFTDLHERTTDAFDKTLLTVASGGLAVSITFVHQIAPHPKHTILVMLSWVLFAAALGASVWSFLFSERAISAYIAEMDEAVENPKLSGEWWRKRTDQLNWIAAYTLTGAVVFLIVFACFNAPTLAAKKPSGTTKAIKKTTSNPPIPPKKPAKKKG